MTDIRDIGIRSIQINTVSIPGWMTTHPQIPSAAVITEQVGVPIIDIPGCVEAHLDNKRGTNNKLTEDDPSGSRIFCDGNMPSFNPIYYNPEEMQWTQPPPKPPTIKPPEVPETPEIPDTAIPGIEKQEIECPGPNAPRIGDVAQNKKERVSGFELQVMNGNEICVTLYEDIPWQSQYLPAPQVAATTATIAVVATSSALLAKPLADLLLKVVKPTVKKVVKKIAAIRGKTVPILSLKERQDLQRERTKAIRVLKSALKPKG